MIMIFFYFYSAPFIGQFVFLSFALWIRTTKFHINIRKEYNKIVVIYRSIDRLELHRQYFVAEFNLFQWCNLLYIFFFFRVCKQICFLCWLDSPRTNNFQIAVNFGSFCQKKKIAKIKKSKQNICSHFFLFRRLLLITCLRSMHQKLSSVY